MAGHRQVAHARQVQLRDEIGRAEAAMVLVIDREIVQAQQQLAVSPVDHGRQEVGRAGLLRLTGGELRAPEAARASMSAPAICPAARN